MKNPFRHLVVVTLTWIVGLAAGVVLLYTIGAQGQCAADIACGQQAERWWYTPLCFWSGSVQESSPQLW